MLSSGPRNTLLPSTGEAKVTPCSVILRWWASENTWKPPESVRIGLVPARETVQAAVLLDDFQARAQIQVEGVAEDDLGAEFA